MRIAALFLFRRAALVAAVAWTAVAPVHAQPDAQPVSTSPDARRLLDAQLEEAAAALRASDGSPPVLFIGAAMDGNSTAFVGDVRATEGQLRTLAPRLAALRLGNGAARPAGWVPVSGASLRETFTRAAALLPQARDDVRVVVLLSSHGGRGLLSTAPSRAEFGAVDAEEVAAWLQPLGSVPTMVVVSACYAGSLLPKLAAENRIVIAAAAANRSSFGCQAVSTGTYFVDALFGRAFEPARPILRWLTDTRTAVAARERAMRLAPPSNPEWRVGTAMRPVARESLASWLSAREAPSAAMLPVPAGAAHP